MPTNFQSQDTSGLIVYTGNSGTRKTVVFNAKDVNGKVLPREGDKVIFSLAQVRIVIKRSHIELTQKFQ